MAYELKACSCHPLNVQEGYRTLLKKLKSFCALSILTLKNEQFWIKMTMYICKLLGISFHTIDCDLEFAVFVLFLNQA